MHIDLKHSADCLRLRKATSIFKTLLACLQLWQWFYVIVCRMRCYLLKSIAKWSRDTINRLVSHATVYFIKSGSTTSFFFVWNPTTRAHDNSLMQEVTTHGTMHAVSLIALPLCSTQFLNYFLMTGQFLFLVKSVLGLGLGLESHWSRDMHSGRFALGH